MIRQIYKFNAGKEIITTQLIGKLKAILISTEATASIRIALNDYPEMVIFESKSLSGSRYVAPMVNANSKTMDEYFVYTQAEWYLNDRLRITTQGQEDKKVRIEFRLE